MVKVSVIVPVFKVPEKFIRECFNSLSAQTLQDSEFVVVSDGAPEKECSICEEFAAKDSRFKFFKRDHAGVSSTRNYGINQASGEYITFVDSDDWIESNCCEDLFKFAQEHNSDVVLFDYIPEGNRFKKAPYSEKNIFLLEQNAIEEIKKQCIDLSNEKFIGAVSTVCKFVKRDLFLKKHIFFANNIKRCEDRPVSYKIFETSRRISYLNKYLYHYQIVESSITHTRQKTLLPSWFPYLTEIKKTSTKYSELIGNVAISAFFCSIHDEYFQKNNTTSLLDKVSELKGIVKSDDFQWTIQDASFDKLKNTPFIIKLDSYFFRHKLTFPIWLHAIKWKIHFFWTSHKKNHSKQTS